MSNSSMSQEQDQEKLLNAAAQVFNNSLSGTLNLASMNRPKTTIEVRSAKDDLSNARSALNKGVNLEAIKQSIYRSPVAQRVKTMGGDVSGYVNSIIKKAKMNSYMEKQSIQDTDLRKTRKRSR